MDPNTTPYNYAKHTLRKHETAPLQKQPQHQVWKTVITWIRMQMRLCGATSADISLMLGQYDSALTPYLRKNPHSLDFLLFNRTHFGAHLLEKMFTLQQKCFKQPIEFETRLRIVRAARNKIHNHTNLILRAHIVLLEEQDIIYSAGWCGFDVVSTFDEKVDSVKVVLRYPRGVKIAEVPDWLITHLQAKLPQIVAVVAEDEGKYF